MIRRLPLVLGALGVAAMLGGTASAGRVHGGIHFGGGFHLGGHVSAHVHVGGHFHARRVHWARPARTYHTHWGVRGHIWVRGYHPHYWYHPYYYSYYYPQYVPSYYRTYYPVQPAPAAPGVAAAVVAPPPPLPRFGIGVFGGGVNTSMDDAKDTQETDFGLLGRFRLTDGLLIEAELGKTSYDVGGVDNVRVDRRLGGSLLYEIGARNRFAPYVLAGLGVQQAQVGGSYSTTQDFGEIGAGLRFAITSHLHLAFDLRAGTRSTVSGDDMTQPLGAVARSVAPPSGDDSGNESYTRGRLSAILYF